MHINSYCIRKTKLLDYGNYRLRACSFQTRSLLVAILVLRRDTNRSWAEGSRMLYT